MKSKLLSGWGFMRILRLVVGAFIMIQGLINREWAFAALGGLFVLMQFLNIGCCGASGCNVPVTRDRKEQKDISYEEVH